MGIRLVVLALAFACLVPVAGADSLTAEQAQELLAQRQASAHPAECARLRRQIDHFTTMQKRAVTLGNEQWSTRMADQVNLLRGMQAARCPDDVPVDTAAQAFAELLKLAAKGAVTYFTFGAGGLGF